MSSSLTDRENFSLGVFAAFVEAICLQPTLYWKNARAQGLPFTLDPKIIYRGTAASIVNEMQMMGMQFGCTGALQRFWLMYMMSDSGSGSSCGGNVVKMDMWNELGLVSKARPDLNPTAHNTLHQTTLPLTSVRPSFLPSFLHAYIALYLRRF